MKRNKRGQASADMLFAGVIIFIVAIVIIISFMVLSKFQTVNNEKIAAGETGLFDGGSKTILDEKVISFPKIWQSVLLFLVFGICLVNAISAFVIRSHPIFFVISFILMIVMAFVMGAFSNIFIAMSGSTALSGFAGSFPYAIAVLSKFPMYMIVINSILAIVMFSKGA